MNLFDDLFTEDRQHPIYRLIKEAEYGPERDVLLSWANNFPDRDNKFAAEFQTSFEPCLWELYLHACFREIGCNLDFSNPSPDFLITDKKGFCVEATIAAPAAGGQPPHGFSLSEIPENFNKFNADSVVRICNSFSSKESKYRDSYSNYEHVQKKPYVIAIASYDRPLSHMAANRPIIAALYGLYYDEDITIERQLPDVFQYGVHAAAKNENTDIPVGLFLDDTYKHVSAVIYSSLATWGKVRAMADNPEALSVYVTLHPNEEDIMPTIKRAEKKNYSENLLDGLYILHNPFAEFPLDKSIFDHPRVAQIFMNREGDLEMDAPIDFLLMRFLQSIKVRE